MKPERFQVDGLNRAPMTAYRVILPLLPWGQKNLSFVINNYLFLQWYFSNACYLQGIALGAVGSRKSNQVRILLLRCLQSSRVLRGKNTKGTSKHTAWLLQREPAKDNLWLREITGLGRWPGEQRSQRGMFFWTMNPRRHQLSWKARKRQRKLRKRKWNSSNRCQFLPL